MEGVHPDVNGSLADQGYIDGNWLTSITDNQKQIFVYVNIVCLCEAVSMFGILANIINVVVYYKEGLNTTINISFFSMSISDLLCLIILQWYIVIPLMKLAGLPMLYSDVQYISGCIPHETFNRMTCSITVYITAERCLCVVFPLKIKRLITPKLTTIVIVFIYIVTLLCPVPIFFTSYLDWNFYPDKNRTLLGLVFTHDREAIESLLYSIHAIVGVLSVIAVVTFTLVLILKIREKSAWRQTLNVQQKQKDFVSNKERMTMFMVVLIAIILLVCYTPSIILCVASLYIPDFSAAGKYVNLHYILWSFALLFETINSSVNIFLYLKMSTKYRRTFHALFTRSHNMESKVNIHIKE